MAFTLGAIAAKDGAGDAVGGGLLAADIAGSGVGPWIIFNGLVDGVAGVNRASVDSSNRLLVLPSGNVASGAADSGNPMKIGGVFNTTQPTVTNGQRVDGQYSARGALIVTHGVDGIAVGGAIAHGTADAGSPAKVGGMARTTNPAAIADAARSNFITDKLGKQVVVGSIRDMKGDQKTTISNSTTETTIVTAVASTFLDLYGLILSNTGATPTAVTIRDVTAGSARVIIWVLAGETRWFNLGESAALKQATVNTAWTAQCSAATTALEVTALYVRNI